MSLLSVGKCRVAWTVCIKRGVVGTLTCDSEGLRGIGSASRNIFFSLVVCFLLVTCCFLALWKLSFWNSTWCTQGYKVHLTRHPDSNVHNMSQNWWQIGSNMYCIAWSKKTAGRPMAQSSAEFRMVITMTGINATCNITRVLFGVSCLRMYLGGNYALCTIYLYVRQELP